MVIPPTPYAAGRKRPAPPLPRPRPQPQPPKGGAAGRPAGIDTAAAAAAGNGGKKKKASAIPSSQQYRSAISILSAQTMREACSCLLASQSPASMNNAATGTGASGTNGRTRLRGIYRRVHAAADVVKRRSAAMGDAISSANNHTQKNHRALHSGMKQPHGHGPRGSMMAASRGGGGGGVGVGSAGVGVGRHGMAQRMSQRNGSLSLVGSRMGMKGPYHPGAARRGGIGSRNTSLGGGPPSKRPRPAAASAAAAEAAAAATEGAAPPPAALNFLAALNKSAGGGGSGTGTAAAAAAAHAQPPPAPPLHSVTSTGSSSSFPGSRTGRSQPKPARVRNSSIDATTSRRRKQQPAAKTGVVPVALSATSAAVATSGSGTSRSSRKGRAAAAAASFGIMAGRSRAFEVGDDVVVQWKDGSKYRAIVKDVDDAAAGVVYNVEFDNGEIQDVQDKDCMSPSSDVEDDSD